MTFEQAHANEILFVGGNQTTKETIGVASCFKLVINQRAHAGRGEFFIEKVKLVSGSSQQLDSFQSNMQNFMVVSKSPMSQALINNEGTIYNMSFNPELERMNFKITDKLKNYIDKIAV